MLVEKAIEIDLRDDPNNSKMMQFGQTLDEAEIKE